MDAIRTRSCPDGTIVLDVDTACAGETFVLTPFKAAYWPRKRTLILSDVHLGHVETYHQFGIALPSAVASGELTRLSRVVERFGPQRVLILGDLLHSTIAVTEEFVNEVARWRGSFPGVVEVVPGNHDRGLHRVAKAWEMTVLDDVHAEDGLEFAHAPCDGPHGFRWCGHLHPAVTLGTRADRFRVPCYAVTGNTCVLPAFSSMAAGSSRGLPVPCRLFATTDSGVVEVLSRAEAAHRRGR